MTLENHIDLPIKRAVALLNLWGLETSFSCCGFDYKNPEVKKDHITNNPQIMFRATVDNLRKAVRLIHNAEFAASNMWYIVFHPRSSYDYPLATMQCHFSDQGLWRTKDSPHAHEVCNCVIKCLEERLLTFKDEMVDFVQVIDYNENMRKIYPHWQYGPAAPWRISKSDYV